jgi:hypothetical protein
VTTQNATRQRRPARNYAGTSPLTVASGTRRIVLADALHWWAFNAPNRSPGALYDHSRALGDPTAAPCVSSATVSSPILHGCLRTQTTYDEHTAWAHRNDIAARQSRTWDV